MELWQLRTFKTLARTLHFTRAAEELHLSQPAVSHHIKILEREVGQPLFERGKTGISLTLAGELMLRHANGIFETTEKMRKDIGDSTKEELSTILIGMIARALESPFAYIYHEFRLLHPNLTPRIHNVSNSEAVLEGVRSGKFDLGLVAFDPECDTLEAFPYVKFRQLFLVGPGHPLEGAGLVNAKSAENLRWALFEPGDQLRVFIDEGFALAGIKPRSIFTTNDGSVIRDMVATGKFVTMLPSWGVFGEISKGTLIHVPVPELEREHEGFVVTRRGARSPVLNAFLEFLFELELPGLNLLEKNKSDKS